MKISYEDKLKVATNPAARLVLETVLEKQTNLSVAADVTTAAELIKLVEQVGEHIAVLKTHIDVVEDFSQDLVTTLLDLKKKYQFAIFEDRKFADIGNTVQLQYSKGVYHIADWADIINAHVVPGPGIIEGLGAIARQKGAGLLLLAEMSAKGNLATGAYTQTAVEWAKQYSDVVIGFIGMKALTDDPRMLTMTPGINLESIGDGLKQQYVTPQQAIQGGSDILIVGRGIYGATDPAHAAKTYKQAGWDAYSTNSI